MLGEYLKWIESLDKHTQTFMRPKDKLNTFEVKKQLLRIEARIRSEAQIHLGNLIRSIYRWYFKQDYDDIFPKISGDPKSSYRLDPLTTNSTIGLSTLNPSVVFNEIFRYVLYYNKGKPFERDGRLGEAERIGIKIKALKLELDYVILSIFTSLIPEYFEKLLNII